MKFSTIGDLRIYLEKRKVSPELLAREVNLSNMTIRRLLKKADASPIPLKYAVVLERLAPEVPAPGNEPGAAPKVVSQDGPFAELLDDLERQGQGTPNLIQLNKDLSDKLEDVQIDRSIRELVSTLMKALGTRKISIRKRAICIGALLYLLNPMDLIPDSTPVVGYLDDFAVLTLAVSTLARED